MTDGVALAAAVLAAGRGSRLGDKADRAKPLLEFRGRPLVTAALDAALASGLAPVLLVVGHEADAVTAVAPSGVEIVRNEHWANGISSSLHAALRALEGPGSGAGMGVGGVVVGLADQPLIGADAWGRVAKAVQDGAPIAVATYGGRRANPVALARSIWPDAFALRGDEGARQLFRDHDVVEVPCDGTGSPDDVDTLEDLTMIEKRSI